MSKNYPTQYFRCKLGCWEETDIGFYYLFGSTHLIHRAMFERRRTGANRILIDERYLFIWD